MKALGSILSTGNTKNLHKPNSYFRVRSEPQVALPSPSLNIATLTESTKLQ